MYRRFWFGLLGLMAGLSIGCDGVSILNDGADGASAKIRIQSAIQRGDLAAFEAALDRVSRTATTRINDVPVRHRSKLDSPGAATWLRRFGIGRA